jgi:hypothetical protein
MKLKLKTIYDSAIALHDLGQNKLIHTFEAMKMRLEMKKLIPIIEEIEKFRRELVEELGDDDANGVKSIAAGTTKHKIYEQRFKQYTANELEVDLQQTVISYSTDKDIGICASHANAVDYFIEFVLKQ